MLQLALKYLFRILIVYLRKLYLQKKNGMICFLFLNLFCRKEKIDLCRLINPNLNIYIYIYLVEIFFFNFLI